MEPKFIVTLIEELSSNIQIHKKPKYLNFDIKLDIRGTGDFSEYITNEKNLDKEKLFNDILAGRIKLQFGTD